MHFNKHSGAKMKQNNKNIPKLAILGYGSMGKEVEIIAKNRKITVTDIFDIDKPINPKENYDFDIAIDFTEPDAVLNNVKILTKMKKNIVIGTTGWKKDFTKIKNIIKRANTGLVYASNFSIGMQMFFKTVDFISKQVNGTDEYDIFLHEIHHMRKKDSPSGTALTLAEMILKNVKRKKKTRTDRIDGTIKNSELHVSSTRGGEVTGTHTVYLDSFADTIELTHRAKNRSGFALGAVEAALWLYNKKGLYDFRDIIDDILDI